MKEYNARFYGLLVSAKKEIVSTICSWQCYVRIKSKKVKVNEWQRNRSSSEAGIMCACCLHSFDPPCLSQRHSISSQIASAFNPQEINEMRGWCIIPLGVLFHLGWNKMAL